MLVPRSFKYASSPPREVLDEKTRRTSMTKKTTSTTRPKSIARSAASPTVPTTPTVPVAVPMPHERPALQTSHSMPVRSRRQSGERKSSRAPHDANALPPAVAALLAVTAIPPRRPNRFRQKSLDQRRVSIDELVNEWKSSDSYKATYGSSPALNILLEDADEEALTVTHSSMDDRFLHTRSTSAESVPSLEADDRSILSFSSPSTPEESLRSPRSGFSFRKDKARYLATTEDSSLDHPLAPLPLVDDDDEDDLILSPTPNRTSPVKPNKSTFTSNLTTSLKALRRTAINSLSSFAASQPSSALSTRSSASPAAFSDEMLWSHPFLFPHFSQEIRPNYDGVPTEAQRRYLNPLPLSFEEQEGPYQQALHAPYLAEHSDDFPTIQMQTYTRGRRKAASNPKRGGVKDGPPDPSSEAGRLALAASGVRQREPRENSSFLRVVVLEMNMRRKGKLECGRARIWLPPRQAAVGGVCAGSRNGVPKRWVGESIVY